MFNNKLAVILVAASIALLSACSGGGGGGSSGSSSTVPAASTLSGVAAVGQPIFNGTVQVKCAGGNAITTTTGSAGAWQATISGQTLPCAVEVNGGTVNGAANPTAYHSIATNFGTTNVTPLSDLIVANLAAQDPDAWFAGLTGATLTPIAATSVDTALNKLRNTLSGLTPLNTINPITATLVATPGTVSDDMLAALQIAMTNAGVSFAALRSSASTGVSSSAVVSLNAALPAAYASTISGNGSAALSFPLQSADKTDIANGRSMSYTISGSCSGSGTSTFTPATTAATFEGMAGFSQVGTDISSVTNCTPASITKTATFYYDSNYSYLGSNSVGGSYGVYLSPKTLPTSVAVGGTGVLATKTWYTDSTKATLSGTTINSYVIEAGTSTTTAIVNFISKSYNAAGTLTSTSQSHYRITTGGVWTPISTDVQYANANGSTTHLLLTYLAQPTTCSNGATNYPTCTPPVIPAANAICTAANFTNAIYNAITLGMTLDQVTDTIGCAYRPLNRTDTYVSYKWQQGSGSYSSLYISVCFDATATLVKTGPPHIFGTWSNECESVYKNGSGF